MGRIKSALVKRTASQISKEKKGLFKPDFAYNKKLLGSTMPSKKIRNKVAGYLAHLESQKQNEQRKPAKQIPAE